MPGTDVPPTRRDLLVFGLALPVMVAVAGFLIGRHAGSAARTGIWVVGGTIAALYAAVPPVRRPLFVGLARVTQPIGWVVSHVVLIGVFALVVTPVALLLRVLGRDPLARRADPRLATYWVTRSNGRDPRRYFRQF